MEPLRKGPPTEAWNDPTGVVSVIIRTRAAGYVPPRVSLRSRIDAHLFTARVDANELGAVREDPEIESVSVASRVRQIG